MIGELAGLGAALSWAGGSLAIKPVSGKLDAFALNALRSLAGWLFLLAILLPWHKLGGITALPWNGVGYVLISGVVSVVVGTTFYIKAMSLVEINKVYPLVYGVWLTTVASIGAIFLHEAVNGFTVAGAVLVIIAIVVLVARSPGSGSESAASQKSESLGFVYAILTGLAWAAGSLVLKFGVSLVDPLLVNVIRLPAIVLCLLLLVWRGGSLREFRRYDLRSLVHVTAGGIMDQGIAAVLYFISIQLAGVARATILSSTSPLFVAPLSVVLLKEKLTRRCLLGTVLSVFGIWLTVIK